ELVSRVRMEVLGLHWGTGTGKELNMNNRGSGKLHLTYKPLEALDELQLLFLAATAEGECSTSLLESIFSLPAAAIIREMQQLAAIGLVVEGHRQGWGCTARGKRVVAVWAAFGKKPRLAVPVASPDWPLGSGTYAVPYEVETEQDIGLVPESNTRLDTPAALQLIAAQESDQQKGRYRAAVGVAVFAWLLRQPDPVRSAARAEPAGFVCDVTDWQLLATLPPPKPVQRSDPAPSAVKGPSYQEAVPPPSDGLLDKLFRWFFG